MHYRITYTCIPIFSKFGCVDQSKRVHKSICKNVISCIELLKKARLSDMHYSTTDIQTEFKINWPINNKINATIKYYRQATDGRTDGCTDVTYDNNR